MKLLHRVLHPGLQVATDHAVGRRRADKLGERCSRAIDEHVARLIELVGGELLGERRTPRSRRVELAEVLAYPFVGDLGQLECLHTRHPDHEIGGFVHARRVGAETKLGADLGADEVIVEAFSHPALANLVQPVFGVQCGHRLAVTGGFQGKRHVIADLRRAAGVDEVAMATTLDIDGFVDLGFRRRRAWKLDAQAAIAGNGDRRPNLAQCVERHRAAVGTAGDFNLGGGDQVDVVLAHRLRQVVGNRVADRFVASGGEADASLEHLARHLAVAEAGQPCLAADLAERFVDVAVELGFVDRDRKPHELTRRALDPIALRPGVGAVLVAGAGVVGRCNRAFHRASTLPWPPDFLPNALLPARVGQNVAHDVLEAARFGQAARKPA